MQNLSDLRLPSNFVPPDLSSVIKQLIRHYIQVETACNRSGNDNVASILNQRAKKVKEAVDSLLESFVIFGYRDSWQNPQRAFELKSKSKEYIDKINDCTKDVDNAYFRLLMEIDMLDDSDDLDNTNLINKIILIKNHVNHFEADLDKSIDDFVAFVTSTPFYDHNPPISHQIIHETNLLITGYFSAFSLITNTATFVRAFVRMEDNAVIEVKEGDNNLPRAFSIDLSKFVDKNHSNYTKVPLYCGKVMYEMVIEDTSIYPCNVTRLKLISDPRKDN